MPKKTKKQKRLAKKHRVRMQKQMQKQHEHTLDAPTYSYTNAKKSAPVKKQKSLIPKQELTLIRKDIVKAVMLAVLAIVFELSLYYVMKG